MKNQLVYGVGINDVSDTTRHINQDGKWENKIWYQKWIDMLRRCYSESYQKRQPCYRGCVVSDEWKYLSNFKSWYESHILGEKSYHLDKDILIPGNKVYSPNTCTLVPVEINCLIVKNQSRRGQYPIGVSFDKEHKKFKSYCQDIVNGKQMKKTIGYYTDVNDAFNAYVQYKSKVIESYIPVVDTFLLSDEMKIRIKKGLNNQIKSLQEGSYA
jgi:hypothetical protein